MLHPKLSKIVNDINSVLLPEVCFGCNAHLFRGEEVLCTFCRNNLPFTEYNFTEENPLDRIFFGRTRIKKAGSFLFFIEKGIVQQLIHYLKYKNQEQIGRFLGDWYGQIVKREGALDAIDVVVPVPLHRKKLRRRGYNQVQLFAERVAFHLDADLVDHVLIKTANIKTQTKKSRIGRWYGREQLYALSDTAFLKNTTILLVDDVITSGATMELCAEALKQTEGVTVYVASMAVVPQFQ